MGVLGVISGLGVAWALAGVAACAAPIAAHLLGRRGRRVMYPPAAILASTAAHSATGARVRDWARLALRCSLLLLLALGFDQPVWSSAPGRPAHSEDVVFLLDRSASMSRSDAGETLFDRARAECGAALRRLDRSSARASVVVIDSAPRPLLPEWSANIDALSTRVESLEPTLERGDVGQTVSLVESLIASSRSAGRGVRVEIFSDRQTTQWEGAALASIGAPLRWRDLGAMTPPNVGVMGIEWSDDGLVVGEPGEIRVRLRRFSAGPGSAPTLVTVRWEGRESTGLIEWSDGAEETTAAFRMTPEEPGFVRVTAELGDDALAADNRVGTLVPARRRGRVALLSGQPSPVMSGVIEASAGAPAVLGPFGSWAGAGVDAVVLVGLGVVSPGRMIEEALAAGVGVVWVIDSAGAASALASVADRPWSPVSGAVTWRRGAPVVGVDAASAAEFLGFSDEAASAGLTEALAASARLHDRAGATPSAGSAGLTLADGSPWALIGPTRRVVVLLAPVEGLARAPMLPLVMDRVLSAVGAPRVVRVVEHPGGHDADAPPEWRRWRPADAGAEGLPAALAPRAWLDERGRPARTDLMVVDPRESDLSALVGEPAHGVRSAAGNPVSVLTPTGRELPLWPGLIGVALVCGLVDLGLSGRSRRRPPGRGVQL